MIAAKIRGNDCLCVGYTMGGTKDVWTLAIQAMPNTELLSGTQRRLLAEILKRKSKQRRGVDALRFKVDHEDDMEALSQLENSRFLERRDDLYFIRLLGLAELSSTHPAAESLLYLCAHVFATVREHYKHHPGDQITVGDLARYADLPRLDVRGALDYLLEPGIWGGYSTDLDQPNAYVVASERILHYKSLDAIIEQLRGWALASAPVTDSVVAGSRENQTDAPVERAHWIVSLPVALRKVFEEVYASIDAGQSSLPIMGLRTVIELTLNELGGDVGNFYVKLDKLVESKRITESKRQVLQDLLEVGHASAHRGHVPNREEVRDTLECVETVVHELLVLEHKARRLRDSAPARHRHIKPSSEKP